MSPLTPILRRYEGAPIVWGKMDCLTFALECAHAAGGKDLRGLLTEYACPRSAARELRKHGFPSLFEALDAHAKPILPAQARTGDIALRMRPGLAALGVVVGAEALFLGEKTLVKERLAGLFIWRA